MPKISESELKKQLDSNDIRNLYVIFGEEKLLVRRAADRIIKKAAGRDFLEFNLNEFTDLSSAVADACGAVPLMAQRKCVAVKDYSIEDKPAVESEKLLELFENLPEETTLIFYYPTLTGKSGAKWKAFLKSAEKHGVSCEFKKRETADLRKMLMREAEKSGCSIARPEAELIIAYAGQELSTLLNELSKLTAFAGEGVITAEMIEETVTKNPETTSFVLADQIISGDYGKAYKTLDTLFAMNAEPVMVLSAISTAYVDMYRVKAAKKSGGDYRSPLEYGDYRGREFRLQKAERLVKGKHTAMLRNSLFELLDADLRLKSSPLSGRLILEELIARLALVAKEEAA